ncbi:undecaprenyl-diphosphate phosphatase [Alkalinema sp. FACHB-956]|uniref:undecaprenyl-diphosphate phosphatase n=1 Tax=Alkalinema sp. FACHB-956 TaxID=2692768 RepID=UPI001681FB85|nr:undecaprenyl-diphosphate phosphatase [Alkalinema sp. FACHB-956]
MLLAETGVTPLFQAFQGIVLGIVQGITEFLPISSTAHLIIFRDLLGWEAVSCADALASVPPDCVPRSGWSKEAIDAIQFGSVVAVLMYFWKDFDFLLRGAWQAFQQKDWRREEWRILIGIVIGTFPALLGGLVFKMLKVELESPVMIAVMSIVMSLLLGLAEKIGSRKRRFSQLKTQDGILVGLGQMIALLPGASRSGSTLTTALFLGLERQTAARFSFLLGFPTLAIATLVQAKEVVNEAAMAVPLLVGIVSTFIFSYLSIAWLLKFLQKQSTWVFVWYRLVFAAFLFTALGLGLLKG